MTQPPDTQEVEALAQLRALALGARGNAYAPYSEFPVGAAVETVDGRFFAGCNVENAAFPQSQCAERNAIAAAVAGGSSTLRRLYVVADPASTPCGGCRSVAAEFATADTEVIVADPAGTERVLNLLDLLPDAFELRRPVGPSAGGSPPSH